MIDKEGEEKFNKIINLWTQGYKEDYQHPITKKLIDCGFGIGRLLCGSKSLYYQMHPKDQIYFNGNIFIIEKKKLKKIYYGDLNITVNKKNLQEIANEFKTDLYILSEHDGRFNQELNIDTVGRFVKIIINCEI